MRGDDDLIPLSTVYDDMPCLWQCCRCCCCFCYSAFSYQKKANQKKRNIFQWKILKSVLDLILFKSLLLVSLNLMCFGVTINGKRWLWGLLWAMPDCFGYFCFRKFVDITRKVNKRNLNCDNGSLLGLF